MKTYLTTHNDDRYGSYFSFKAANGLVNDPSFNWKENNKEFRYKGEWYDVVSIKYSGDSIKICSIKDDRENKLEKQLAQIHQHKNNGSSTTSISLIKFFSLFYISENNSQAFSHSGVTNYWLTADRDCFPAHCQISIPPPRC